MREFLARLPSVHVTRERKWKLTYNGEGRGETDLNETVSDHLGEDEATDGAKKGRDDNPEHTQLALLQRIVTHCIYFYTLDENDGIQGPGSSGRMIRLHERKARFRSIPKQRQRPISFLFNSNIYE